MNWFGTNKGEGYEFDLLFWAIAIVIQLMEAPNFLRPLVMETLG